MKYATPQAFRRALDDRLRAVATKRGVPVQTLQLKMLIERLLARLFQRADAPWILKGGYTFELRYRPKARTTRDIDLGVPGDPTVPPQARLDRVRDALQEAAEADLGDFIQFRIGAAWWQGLGFT